MEIDIRAANGTKFSVKTGETYPISTTFNTRDEVTEEVLKKGFRIDIAGHVVVVESGTTEIVKSGIAEKLPQGDGKLFTGRLRGVDGKRHFIDGTLCGAYPLMGSVQITATR